MVLPDRQLFAGYNVNVYADTITVTGGHKSGLVALSGQGVYDALTVKKRREKRSSISSLESWIPFHTELFKISRRQLKII